ncbi:serine dehydratase-like [Lissotriton helveticus]
MGAAFAPDLAILYMAEFERDHILTVSNPYETNIWMWRRYIDDVLMLWTGSEVELNGFFTWLNNQSQDIQFTMSMSKTSIDFLDISIKVQNGHLHTTLFRKPTERNSLLRYTSHHTRSLRDNLPFGQFLRIRRNCSLKEDYFLESDLLIRRLMERGYPRRLVTRARKRAWYSPREDLLKPRERPVDPERIICVTTFCTKSNLIKKTVNKHWTMVSDVINHEQLPMHAFKKSKNIRDKVYVEQGTKHFICSSGGNTGIADAYAAEKLGVSASILVPNSTLDFTVQKIKGYGFDVEVFGKVWDDANDRALELAKSKGWVYVSPFDHPLIWEGHASLIKEIQKAMPCKPGAIILSVAGGGLLLGVVDGLKEVGWADVPIIAMETKGADCLNACLKAGKKITLPDITSVATCLGAKSPADRAFQCAQECPIISEVVDDREAVAAMEKFLDDERILVEPACGASLAAIYSGLIQRLQSEGRLSSDLAPIVVIVCGGNSINLAQLNALKIKLGLQLP